MITGRPSKDHTNKQYGHWTVLRRQEKSGPSTAGVPLPWLCECSVCSNQVWLAPKSFEGKVQRPTRCEVCEVNRKQEEEEAKQARRDEHARLEAQRLAVVEEIKRGERMHPRRLKQLFDSALYRNIDFDLTEEQLLQLWRDQGGHCALSGLPITMKTTNSETGTASLDRKDSARGYTIDNVIWVHPTINMMKYTLSEGDFVRMCHHVAAHNAEALAGMQITQDNVPMVVRSFRAPYSVLEAEEESLAA